MKDVNGPLIDTSVSVCHLDSDRDMPLSQAVSCLSADETDRMNRFVFDEDRFRFARGRGFLRRALGQSLEISPASVVFSYGPNGKPYVRGSDLAFNLSHAEDTAVLIAAHTGAIGVDLEFAHRRFSTQTDLIDLAERCFTPSEMDVLSACPIDVQKHRFLQFWTAKEARMKLWGDGMALDPKSIELVLESGQPVGYQEDPEISLGAILPEQTGFICYCATSALTRSAKLK